MSVTGKENLLTGHEVYGDGKNEMITFTGKRFDPQHPETCPVDLTDIAHALSLMCRFGGHTREFYSVAQHCVLVSRNCGDDSLWGLLHDASEAYLVDIPRPIKYSPGFREEYHKLEAGLMAAITKHFKLTPDQPQSVTDADQRVGLAELRDLMPKVPLHFKTNGPIDESISGWSPKEAEQEYFKRFQELTN